MKVGIFTPYLDTLGGGERHVLALAVYLAEKGNEVDIFWDDLSLKDKIKERLGMDLGKINFTRNVFKENIVTRFFTLRHYDLVFFLSDGSLPFLFGKKNWLCFFVPFTGVNRRNIFSKLKMRLIDRVIVNSQFTKKFIDREFDTDSDVLYPPSTLPSLPKTSKENIILSVGRFSRYPHNKRQDILVETFKHMVDQGLASWKLVLVGGTDHQDDFLDELKSAAKNYPIEIVVNAPYRELLKMYSQAKIFWLATGFGFDQNINPEKTEHFGIVTVEAMSAGLVPVVIRKGGQPEIVTEGETGLLWETEEELSQKTLNLITSEALRQKLVHNASLASRMFDQKAFYKRIDDLLSKNS